MKKYCSAVIRNCETSSNDNYGGYLVTTNFFSAYLRNLTLAWQGHHSPSNGSTGGSDNVYYVLRLRHLSNGSSAVIFPVISFRWPINQLKLAAVSLYNLWIEYILHSGCNYYVVSWRLYLPQIDKNFVIIIQPHAINICHSTILIWFTRFGFGNLRATSSI